MGSRGPVQKPHSRRRNRPPGIALARSSGQEPPACPKGLLKVTRDSWAAYWQSDVAQVAQPVHLPIIRRLFLRYDGRERAHREVRRTGMLTTGSTGQDVQNPLLSYIDACDRAIQGMEDRLGLSPGAMLRMGNAFSGIRKSLDERNAAILIDEDEEDPRLKAIR